MTLLSAFLVLLHRYSAEEDIVVGCPVAGRGHTDTEALIGLFINTLVLRADLSGDPSFAEVLRRVRGLTIDAFAHQDLPFARLVEELHPVRSLGLSPLFQVAFVLQNATTDTLDLEGASVAPLPFDNGTIDLDIRLRADREPARPHRDPALRRRPLRRRDRGPPLCPLPRRHRRGDGGSGHPHLAPPPALPRGASDGARGVEPTEAPYPEATRVDTLVRAQVARTPDAVAISAVSHAGEQVTYRALEARARAIAGRLSALGAGPGARVAIYLDRSPAMVTALLGVLWSGAAYVPLDPEYPADRTAFVLADAGALVVVTERHLAPTLPAGAAHVLLVDEAEASQDESSSGPRHGDPPPTLRTSSTPPGRPASPRASRSPTATSSTFYPHGAQPGARSRRRPRGGDDALLRHRRAGNLAAPRDRRP